MQETQQIPKKDAVKALARIRGVKGFTNEQLEHIDQLCAVDGLSPRDILNEVLETPGYPYRRGAKRAVNLSREQVSNICYRIAELIKPK